jgi:SpoVK/Ycf46/Vps4 family AAA+-type ATPase
MVLYGPPGTSKTTFAEAIAKEMTWPLLTITPSDFVKNGIERSEDMARAIFNDLLELRKVVVLFDECDEMFRSRSDKDRQDIGMLRFIVPGMLPKLQRLKKHGEQNGVIFIIATNYCERLDSAIIRPGRIDELFLVPPYDEKSRIRLIDAMLFRKQFVRLKTPRLQAARSLAEWTAGWVYKEIDELVTQFVAFAAAKGLDRTLAGTADVRELLRVELKVQPSPPDGYSLQFTPSPLRRALSIEQVYRDRPGARAERDIVEQICRVK